MKVLIVCSTSFYDKVDGIMEKLIMLKNYKKNISSEE